MTKVFTNGCYDILHRGHIELFEYARSLGDYLVVAIDSDTRVKTNKGPNRPHNSQSDREYVLRALKSIDDVVVFDSDEELSNIIQNYCPSFMVVGSDWRGKKVIGQEHARELIFFERIDGYSTTKTIQNLVNRR